MEYDSTEKHMYDTWNLLYALAMFANIRFVSPSVSILENSEP